MKNENPTLTLELPLNEVNTIMSALMEIPAKFANPLMEKIAKQCKAQLEPAPETATEAKAEVVKE